MEITKFISVSDINLALKDASDSKQAKWQLATIHVKLGSNGSIAKQFIRSGEKYVLKDFFLSVSFLKPLDLLKLHITISVCFFFHWINYFVVFSQYFR